MHSEQLFLSNCFPFDINAKKWPNILIFDSGVGGLSIYNEIKFNFPNAHYLYVFDNEGYPYGEKSDQFIIDRVINIISAMWQLHKIDLIIIACNTASTISLSVLRKFFYCPIIGVVPAIKPAAKITRNGVIGLLATIATIQCVYTHKLINQFASNCKILKLGTSELVNIAEAKLQGKLVPLSLLRKLFCHWLNATEPPDTIVLGCTHFSLLRQELQHIFPKGTNIVDSVSSIAYRTSWLIKNKVNINNLIYNNNNKNNKVYYIVNKPQIKSLIPVLIYYGFSVFKKLTI